MLKPVSKPQRTIPSPINLIPGGGRRGGGASQESCSGRDAGGGGVLRCQCTPAGKGLGSLTTVFDAEDEPAWLKSVALRFAVVASHQEADVAQPEPGLTQQPMADSTGSQIAGSAKEKQLTKQEQVMRAQSQFP